MSNAVFPSSSTLPGLSWGVGKTPIWRTLVQSAASGKETRIALMSYPLWKYSLSYEVLRASSAHTELQTLIGFFNARQGSYDNFLYQDPDDNTISASSPQNFGASDGTTTTKYPLVRAYGAFIEPVQSPAGVGTIPGTPPVLYDNNASTVIPSANYTIDQYGQVQFSTPPTSGHVLLWSGSYYWRCRFLQDLEEFSQFMYQLWELKKIEFQTVKL